MSFKLLILGCHAATPRSHSNPTAQVLEMGSHLFLIDCGEGTQVSLRKNKVKFSRINHIFISHLHGDHFFGLPGLISTFRLLGREKELHVYGPKGIKEAMTLLLKLGQSWTNYPLIFHELTSTDSEVVLEDEKVIVKTIPLDHRIYTNGFLFAEKEGERKINIEETRRYGIHHTYYQMLKAGKDFTLQNGEDVPNAQLTLDPPAPASYAYCSDTVYDPALVSRIKNATVLYHEATFLEAHKELALKTKHSTASQAAKVAKAAGVETLILGHYSTRYKSTSPFKKEAGAIFENVELAEDGKRFSF